MAISMLWRAGKLLPLPRPVPSSLELPTNSGHLGIQIYLTFRNWIRTGSGHYGCPKGATHRTGWRSMSNARNLWESMPIHGLGIESLGGVAWAICCALLATFPLQIGYSTFKSLQPSCLAIHSHDTCHCGQTSCGHFYKPRDASDVVCRFPQHTANI